MVALKAELGPFIPGVPGVSGPSWDVFVAAGSDALPGTGTALGTFEHNSATDPFDKGLNHVVLHHIQDILYRRQKDVPGNVTPPPQAVPPVSMYTGPAPGSMFPYGFTNMANINMKRHGATMLSTAMTGAAVTMAVAATATIVLKGQPGDTTIVNADVVFTSGNVAIATVASTGVVTGVAAGNTVIHCVNRYNNLTVDVAVTVTATAGLFEAPQEEARARDDDERSDNPKVAVEDIKEQKDAPRIHPKDELKGDPRLAKLGARVEDDDDDEEDDDKGGKRKKTKK